MMTLGGEYVSSALVQFRQRETALGRTVRGAQRHGHGRPVLRQAGIGGRQHREANRRLGALRYRACAIDPPLLVHHRKQVIRSVCGFGRPEEQQPVRPQGEVEELQDLPLYRAFQIDQHVSTRDQVQVRERRIAQQTVRREQDALAHRLADGIVRAFPGEITLQESGRHIVGDGQRIRSRARPADGRHVDIGGKHLDGPGRGRRLARLGQQDRNGIRFLARGAAGHPHPHLVVIAQLAVEQRRNHFPLEKLEGFAIPEELRDPDQHVAQQCAGLVRRCSQEIPVRRQVALAIELHAPLDATEHRGALVEAEVMPRAHTQMHQDFGQRTFPVRPGRLPALLPFVVFKHRILRLDALDVLPQIHEPLRHRGRRQYDIDPAGVDGGARHLRMLGVVRRLGQRQAADFADPAHSDGAIGSGAGQHDADGSPLVCIGEGAEEMIDREGPPKGIRLFQDPETAIGHLKVGARRHHINVILLKRCRGTDFADRHGRGTLNQGHDLAFEVRRQVKHHDEGHAHLFRGMLEQRLQGPEAAGGGSEANDREMQRTLYHARRISHLLLLEFFPRHDSSHPRLVAAAGRGTRRHNRGSL